MLVFHEQMFHNREITGQLANYSPEHLMKSNLTRDESPAYACNEQKSKVI